MRFRLVNSQCWSIKGDVHFLNRDDMTIELFDIAWGQRNREGGVVDKGMREDKVVFWMVFQLHSPQT